MKLRTRLAVTAAHLKSGDTTPYWSQEWASAAHSLRLVRTEYGRQTAFKVVGHKLRPFTRRLTIANSVVAGDRQTKRILDIAQSCAMH